MKSTWSQIYNKKNRYKQFRRKNSFGSLFCKSDPRCNGNSMKSILLFRETREKNSQVRQFMLFQKTQIIIFLLLEYHVQVPFIRLLIVQHCVLCIYIYIVIKEDSTEPLQYYPMTYDQSFASLDDGRVCMKTMRRKCIYIICQKDNRYENKANHPERMLLTIIPETIRRHNNLLVTRIPPPPSSQGS